MIYAVEGPIDIMRLRTRIIWNVAAYLFMVVVYFTLSDGHGRFDFLLKLTVVFWPFLMAVDVAIAYRRPK